VVSTSVLAFTGLAAYPVAREHAVPVKAAWFWVGSSIEKVPLPVPVEGPSLHRAGDGSVFVVGAEGESPQRFDHDSRRFERLTESPPNAPYPSWPNEPPAPFAVNGDAALWCENASPARRTYFRKAGAWSDGPRLTSLDVHGAFAEGSRTVVLSNSAAGPVLLVADVGEEAFQELPLHGSTSWELNFLAPVGRDETRLLVVTQLPDQGAVSTHVIDTTLGEVTDGPPLETAPGALVTGEWVAGGGLLLVAQDRSDGVVDPVRDALAGVALLAQLAALGAAFAKKKLELGHFLAGLILGVVPLALEGAGVMLWVITHAKHLW
jgi:hypothetical protein